jgi:hypothetical protein
VAATRLGVHRGDGRLDDVSLANIAVQAGRLHAEQAELAALDPAALSPSERDDRDILSAAIARELLDDETIQPWRHDPDSYVSLAVNAVYDLIDRDFAPLPERMRAAVSRERAMPALFALAEAQLADVPQPFLDIAREDLDGSFDFVGKDAPSAFASVDDQGLQDELAASTTAALAAMDGSSRRAARSSPRTRPRSWRPSARSTRTSRRRAWTSCAATIPRPNSCSPRSPASSPGCRRSSPSGAW